MAKDKNRVCPVELAGSLDSKFRRWLQNPYKILTPYVKEGMKVLDIGCGPGFFSIEMAKIVGQKGKVIAADLQEGMLWKIQDKINGSELEKIIQLHKTDKDKINVSEKVDFALAFYMVHEVPNKENLFIEIKNLLVEKGKFLVVEPHFHVSKKAFETTMNFAKSIGFSVIQGFKLSIGRYAVLTNA